MCIICENINIKKKKKYIHQMFVMPIKAKKQNFQKRNRKRNDSNRSDNSNEARINKCVKCTDILFLLLEAFTRI